MLPRVESAETSVIILKPDGFRRPEAVAFVESLLRDSGLETVVRYSMTFDRDDVLDTWSYFEEAKFRISRELQLLYMTSGPSGVMVVRGPCAVARCKEIKQIVRRRFGTAFYRNVLHCPSDAFEIVTNLGKFYVAVPNGTPFTRLRTFEELDGVFGRLARLSDAEVQRVTRELWTAQETRGLEAFLAPRTHDQPFGVRLIGNDRLASDYVMSVLAEFFPHERVEEILRIYHEADAFDRAVVHAGSESDMLALNRSLKSFGLAVECARLSGEVELGQASPGVSTPSWSSTR